MPNRRDFLATTVGAGATLALTPGLLRGLQAFQQPGVTLIQRAIPSSGELLPAIGLSFSNHAACADHAALKDVLRLFADRGGRVFDAMHVSNAEADEFHVSAPRELAIEKKLFYSVRGTPGGVAPQPGGAFVHSYIDSLLSRLNTSKLDLVMLPAASEPAHIAALKEEKKAGRVRYIGVQTISVNTGFAQLESVMRSEPLDFIGVDYDIGNRARVEGTVLPLAQERKIGVMAFFPFGNNGGVSCGSGSNLFARAGTRPLPEWAAEFDATSWSHFFLKYAIGHPAITVARVGTTKASHMLDNMGGGVGRLPDEATRKRMAAFLDSLPTIALQQSMAVPLVVPAPTLDRYVGEYKDAGGTVLTFRRYGTTLVVKPTGNPESVLFPRTATRFSLGPNVIEFQLDGAGSATGIVFEQGGQKISATRVR